MSIQRLVHPKYRADIDGLRAIAVLSVVGFHAFPTLVGGGFIGVDIFFVISGFLISTILIENIKEDRFSFLEFYIRRVRRIFPALLTVLIACHAFGWFELMADEYRQLGRHIVAGAGFVSNLALWSEAGYFDSSADTKPLLHLWSLGIEEQFYILWPLLLWGASKRRLNLLVVTVLLTIVSFAFNVHTVNIDKVADFYSPLTRMWELLIGSLLALVTLYGAHPALRYGREYGNWWSAGGIILILGGVLALNSSSPFPGWWALLPTIGTACTIFAGPEAWINRLALSNRVLVWFGAISYPLYLWHWPALAFARIMDGERPSHGVRLAAVLCSIALAWMTYRFIERPIRFGGQGRLKAIWLGAFMLAVGFVGYDTYANDGLPFRKAVTSFEVSKRARDQFVGPVWKYTKNDVCLKRYPFKESDDYAWWFCILEKDRPPTVILLGNSYANQLYPGLATNNVLTHQTILSIGTCDPANSEEPVDMDLTAKDPCAGHRSRDQAQLINAIIKEGSLQYALLDGLNDNPDFGYIKRLTDRIDFLEKHNIKVVVFMPHVHVDYDIHSCFPRPLMRVRSCTLDVSERIKLNQRFRVLIDAIQRTNPNVLFFDQNDLFCDATKCSMIRDGMPLLRDQFHHMSEYGSVELSKLFAQWATRNLPEILDKPTAD